MTQFIANKWVDGAATGTGDGSQTNPWTMAQAIANASPGDVIQLNAGTIAGSNTAQPKSACFPITRAGTSTQPIIWFAENYAALSSTGRTTFTHPGTTTGNPVIGLTAPYNYVYGVHVYEPNAMPGRDTGSIIIEAPHVKLCYCHLDRAQAEWPTYTSGSAATNLAGVYIEPTEAADVFDVQLTDNLFTNYTADSNVLYGCAAVMMFSITTRFCHDITFENNTFDYVNVAVYVKGAGTSRPVRGGLVFRRNLSRVNDDGYGVNIYHYNLSDTDDTYGPNVFVQNLSYGGRMFVRPHFQGGGVDTRSVYLINNTSINMTGTGEDGWLRDSFQGNQSTPTWRIHNNILHTGTRFYCMPYFGSNGSDSSVLSRDRNTAYNFSNSYSYVGNATPAIGAETLSQLQSRTGQDLNSQVRDPLLASTTWGNAQFGQLQSTSSERNSGVDILDLLGGGTSGSINRGCFITSNMSDLIGVRPLSSGIEFNAASQAAAETATISVSHTAAGANRHVLIGVMNDGTVPSSVTYGTQTPTLLRTEGRLHLYSLLNPDTGAQTVSAVSAIGVTNQVIAVVSRTGVASVGTAVGAQNDEESYIDVNVSSAPGNLVADFCLMVRLEMEAASGQTERVSYDDPGVGYLSIGMSDKPGASSVTMQWLTDETFGDNAIIAVPLIAA
ncbi:hypothetical protein [Steroidobacter cummioxidans]|uniref:hypothetical protein n=1 Tax=Steroidobacter cummioxidans TaxID=1803913 RepID=UPI000E30CBFF|nr:hypothetical protein [Steroidobacter cummioxidans]